MNRYSNGSTPEGVQIQPTRHRPREVILCIFVVFVLRCPIQECPVFGTRISRCIGGAVSYGVEIHILAVGISGIVQDIAFVPGLAEVRIPAVQMIVHTYLPDRIEVSGLVNVNAVFRLRDEKRCTVIIGVIYRICAPSGEFCTGQIKTGTI